MEQLVVKRLVDGHVREPLDLRPILTGDAEAAQAARAGDDGYDLVLDTLPTLKAVFAAPRPDTSGWPGGWQGSGAFERDVRRVGCLVAGLYEQHQLPSSDAVEETLENVAVGLRADSQPRIDRPLDRTGWRIAHDRDERGPEAATAEILGKLMSAAFNAGFDRHALLTGRRLLAVITGAAEAGDLSAVDAYGQALEKATRAMTRHYPDHRLAAHQHRGSLLLAGLIAELDPLFATCSGLRNGPGLGERINQVAETLAWSTSGNPYPLAAAAWQARLTAAGWPACATAWSSYLAMGCSQRLGSAPCAAGQPGGGGVEPPPRRRRPNLAGCPADHPVGERGVQRPSWRSRPASPTARPTGRHHRGA